jgi:hypothetical protein
MDGSRLDDFDLSELSPRGEPRPAWTPAARWAVGCGSGCALAVLLQALFLWGGIAFFFNLRAPEGLQSSVNVPPTVVPGKPFPLTLVVRNEGDRPFTVDAVTTPARSPVTLKDPKPAPPSLGTGPTFGGMRAWVYQKQVAPGEKWTVTFTATAQSHGTTRGTLQVQCNHLPMPVNYTLHTGPGKLNHKDTKTQREDQHRQ